LLEVEQGEVAEALNLFGDVCTTWCARTLSVPMLSIVGFAGRALNLDLDVPHPTRLTKLFGRTEVKRKET
jgi:hypothetical protein